eukprot:CAMPEP_0114332036 /NCGR_PEP_ID=MMETSP0101-20121206/2810_1 /TAXON_ID=38822 ORGANISM="Pteridomonas danica, Strain PT" /NCGR_SAMPLE_ID=MMETSP0101 /ASSEMBLY_ACC=CAM_ASM_000211 /LENGTH=272 /DNA_ID=CAMNT_0001462567 /DNA_START=982 /DNA_END=1800 /DNA_ORIENTATION=-
MRQQNNVGYLKRVIVTPAFYPRLVEFLHFDIQSTNNNNGDKKDNNMVVSDIDPNNCFINLDEGKEGSSVIANDTQNELNNLLTLLDPNLKSISSSSSSIDINNNEFYSTLDFFLTGYSSDQDRYQEDYLLKELSQNLNQVLGNVNHQNDASVGGMDHLSSSSSSSSCILSSSSSSSSVHQHIHHHQQHHEARQILKHVVGDGKEEWVRKSLGVDEYEDENKSMSSVHSRMHRTSLVNEISSSNTPDKSARASVSTILEEGVEVWELNAKFEM